MDNQGDWSCDANGAVQISIVQPSDTKLKLLSTFQPQFTYPIFGDEETIFGYKGLLIRLRFAAHDLRPNVHISYDERFKTVGDTAATDLNKALKPFLPEESFVPSGQFEKAVLEDESAKDFKPPGKLVHSYSRKKRNYEIWAGSLADPEIRSILDRIQIFVSFFIEAGTHIETDDFEWTLQRWMVYFVYEKVEPPTPTASPYSFVGYATTYRWWYFDNQTSIKDAKTSDGPFPYPHEVSMAEVPSRLRISQFLILPSHQLSGHGSHLYRTIQSDCLADPTIHELTIEDPNEAFDALRDTCDYHTLQPEFARRGVTINPNPYPPDAGRSRPRHVPTSSLIPTDTLRTLRSTFKIAPTQFAHLTEMYLLSLIPASHRGKNANMARLLVHKFRAQNEHDRRYYWWRMLVKQRLYKRHRDLLIQMDREERFEKLDETLGNVEEGYENLLKAFELKSEVMGQIEREEGEEEEREGLEERSKERLKRKFVVEDEDDEESGSGSGSNGTNGNGESSKKLKT